MKEFPPVPELNWCGVPIRPGEGYGGRPENIPKTLGRKPGQAVAESRQLAQAIRPTKEMEVAENRQHFAVITESHLAEIFGNGSLKRTRADAAKLLELHTGAHRTSCYRALWLKGRFARHLRADGRTLSWR